MLEERDRGEFLVSLMPNRISGGSFLGTPWAIYALSGMMLTTSNPLSCRTLNMSINGSEGPCRTDTCEEATDEETDIGLGSRVVNASSIVVTQD